MQPLFALTLLKKGTDRTLVHVTAAVLATCCVCLGVQTFALDLGLFVEEIVRQRGILPRGLAHPAIFEVIHPALATATPSSPPRHPCHLR